MDGPVVKEGGERAPVFSVGGGFVGRVRVPFCTKRYAYRYPTVLGRGYAYPTHKLLRTFAYLDLGKFSTQMKIFKNFDYHPNTFRGLKLDLIHISHAQEQLVYL